MRISSCFLRDEADYRQLTTSLGSCYIMLQYGFGQRRWAVLAKLMGRERRTVSLSNHICTKFCKILGRCHFSFHDFQ